MIETWHKLYFCLKSVLIRGLYFCTRWENSKTELEKCDWNLLVTSWSRLFTSDRLRVTEPIFWWSCSSGVNVKFQLSSNGGQHGCEISWWRASWTSESDGGCWSKDRLTTITCMLASLTSVCNHDYFVVRTPIDYLDIRFHV